MLLARVAAPVSRVVEALAATSENTPIANPASARASFTGEFANELARRKGRGDASFELAEVIDALRAVLPSVFNILNILNIIFQYSEAKPTTSICFENIEKDFSILNTALFARKGHQSKADTRPTPGEPFNPFVLS